MTIMDTNAAAEFISVNFNKHPVTGYLFSTEWPYYVLDALPIAVRDTSLCHIACHSDL
jgi:hypothetical protein